MAKADADAEAARMAAEAEAKAAADADVARLTAGAEAVAAAEAAAARVPAEAEDIALAIGARVRLVNLQARPDMNGETGVLVRFDAGKGRWIVEIPWRHPKLFKPANLVGVE